MLGPYRLDGLLGRGLWSEVHRAYDTHRERDVALKLLPESLSSDWELQTRFRRSTAVAARLRDPHIVPIHDFGETDGRLFVDMRLIYGSDLGNALGLDGALRADRAVTIIEQVAQALDAVHEAGLIHCTVAPRNVLLASGRPGRADFCYLTGLGSTRPATMSDEPAPWDTDHPVNAVYAPPEWFFRGTVEHRVDVYSLACLLYESLTAHGPFSGDGITALLHGHTTLPPPRPTEENPALPVGFDDVIATGMAKDPDDRYPTAGELAAAARAALNTSPATAR